MAREDIIKVSGCDDRQRARWRAAAGDASLAAWMRKAADAYADGVTARSAADIAGIETALAALRSDFNNSQVGNNANQIAAALNKAVKEGLAMNVGTVEAQTAAVLSEFVAVREKVTEALAIVRALLP